MSMNYPFTGSHPITQVFGNKSKRYASGVHNGVDWSMPVGTPLYAPFDGYISRVERWRMVGFGRTVYIRSDDGRFEVILGHMSEILKGIQPLDVVKEGTLLGKSGNTGNSTGPHLHMTLYDGGKLVDPIPYCSGSLFDVKQYVVQKGDTLSKISQKMLGSAGRWNVLYEKNRDIIKNPDILQVGQILRIP